MKTDIVQQTMILDGMLEARIPRIAMADRLSKMAASCIEKVADNLQEIGDTIRMTVRIEAWRVDIPHEQTLSWKLAELIMDQYGTQIVGSRGSKELAAYQLEWQDAQRTVFEQIHRRIKEVIS